MKILTIGFTQKSAEGFFSRLQAARATRVVDVRLNNTSQLAGFTKQEDLRFFLRAVADIGYVHEPLLAPTADMLNAYKKKQIGWDAYAQSFIELMRARHIETTVSREILDGGCLLCSEDQPHHCHRRLVAEYLRDHWGNVEVMHLA